MGYQKYFYMVYLEDGANPIHRHISIESAQQEAQRLAQLHNKKAYILCTLSSIEIIKYVETKHITSECAPPLKDELPF